MRSFSISIIQYSRTPAFGYFMSFRNISRSLVDGEMISATKSGAPVIQCLVSLFLSHTMAISGSIIVWLSWSSCTSTGAVNTLQFHESFHFATDSSQSPSGKLQLCMQNGLYMDGYNDVIP